MNVKRTKSKTINKADQLAVLASPLSMDILQAIRTGGPVSVGELGPRVGRKAVSLHYHVRKLKRLGFLREVDTRRSGARTEAIYDVAADFFEYDSAPKSASLRKCVNDIVAAMLRLATRNFAAATERPGDVRDSGAHRNMLGDRLKARLTKSELARVNKHLDAVRDVFVSADRTHGGELCTLTLVLTPEPDRSGS